MSWHVCRRMSAERLLLRQFENMGLVKWQGTTTERHVPNGIPVPSLDKALLPATMQMT